MVQIHPPTRKDLLRESMGQSIGQGLSSFVNNYFAGKALDDVVNNPEYESAPMSERASKLERAMRPYGEFGGQVLQNRIGIEQQVQQEGQQRALAKAQKDWQSGKTIQEKDLEKLSPEDQFKFFQLQKNKEAAKKFRQNLVNMEFDPDLADNLANAFENAPTGGQTEVIKGVMDLYNRGLHKKSPNSPQGQAQGQPEGVYEYPEIPDPVGLTAKDKVAYHAKLRQENSPHFEDNQRLSRFYKKEKTALGILKGLSPKLPEGIGSAVVDPETGDLRPYAQLAGLVNPETQRFLKTIYDFTTQAKDSFGSRVTNFDLQTFLKRLPSLLNSEEGRSQIIQQMEIINQLNSIYENGLKDVYQHYGLGNIPYEKAVQIIENKISPEEERLTAMFDQIGQESQEKPLTPEIIDKYLEMANNDHNEAAKLARKDGYKF